MTSHGTIKHWNDEQAYGFIEPASGGKDVFVHINALLDKTKTPAVGQLVSYRLSKDKKGRTCAVKVRKAGDRANQRKNRNNRKSGASSLLIAIGFLSFVAILVSIGTLTVNVLYIYLIASVITYIAYANDKSKAKNEHWRTPESTLHLLALVGGWPGALIAQQHLRHKSQKQEFRFLCWITVVINVAACCWLFTDSGQIIESKIDAIGNRTNGSYIEWTDK